MKKKKNIAGTAYWAVLIAGSILLILYCLMQSVPKNLVFRYVTIWVLVLLAGAIIVFFVPYGKEGKKLDAMMPLLDTNPDQYIRELTAFLEQTSSGMIFQVGLLNLAVAYCRKRNHKKAQETLNQVQPGNLSIANKAVYWSTLALTCFYLGQTEDGCRIIDKRGKDFMDNPRLNHLGAAPAILMIFYHLEKHQKKEARELYAKARKKWYGPQYKADFDYLEKQLQKK